jgi:poly(3-hydroxybutyrate) depolymerase
MLTRRCNVVTTTIATTTLLLAWLLSLPLLCAASTNRALPAYGANIAQVTVSGLSSGAYMAGQFAVAFSSMVSGAALVAGGPYFCAGQPGIEPYVPYLINAMTHCMNPADSGVSPPDPALLWQRTLEFSRAGLIDDADNLRHQSVYLFSGRSDHTVTTTVVDQTYGYYRLAGVRALRYRDNVDAGHAMITDNSADNDCFVTAAPYINNCGLPLARELFASLYPDVHPASGQLSGRIVHFDQRPYAPARAGMDDDGYAYVPATCRHSACRVHVAFHGCRQGDDAVGDRFYAHAGYNPVADANAIIVLYPQVRPSGYFPYNPRGCWDFWGYSSYDPFHPDFYTRDAVQMTAVLAMLKRLAQSPLTQPSP